MARGGSDGCNMDVISYHRLAIIVPNVLDFVAMKSISSKCRLKYDLTVVYLLWLLKLLRLPGSTENPENRVGLFKITRMKSIIRLRVVSTMIAALLLCLLGACEDNFVQKPQAKEVGKVNDQAALDLSGRIGGPRTVLPGRKQTFVLESDFNFPSVTWSVEEGQVKLLKGQGSNSAEFEFGPNFTTAQIRVDASYGNNFFSEIMDVDSALPNRVHPEVPTESNK